jgi:hypothetical protein|tara:strand:+ start:4202 stop:4327 length:126 start_codon:yes stop_codon:yes gene_type:complete
MTHFIEIPNDDDALLDEHQLASLTGFSLRGGPEKSDTWISG